MHTYFLAIPLPKTLKSRLTTLCYGLPGVRWVEEENFHLTLHFLGTFNDQLLASVQEHLTHLFFHPFPLILQGAGHSHAKGNSGTIWLGIAEPPALHLLKKEINRHLRGLQLPPGAPRERLFLPHITLGYYEQLNPKRLGDYLMGLADYQSLPFQVSQCILMRSHQTPKRTIYEAVDEYAASELHVGDD